MMYFNGITNIEQAKLRYRKLAKQLHPDAGGTAHEFQKLQDEYKATIERLKQYGNLTKEQPKTSPEYELLSDLGRLAKVLLKKQVPQSYLKQQIKMTDSSLKKGMLEGVLNFLDGLRNY